MKDQYAAFAADYDWLFSDFQQVGDRHVREAEPRLAARERPRILDCACGTGLLALALARHGYDVVGTDACSEMIEQARARAASEGLSCPLAVCTWLDLPRRFDAEFDFVFCGGNSIAHCQGEAEMIESLISMRTVLKPGGRLIVETRDWERLLRERVRFTSLGLRERGDERCYPLYVWTFADETDAPIAIEVVFLFEAGGHVTLRSYPITYQPFTAPQLMNRLRDAGFVDVGQESEGRGLYHVEGKADAASLPSTT